MRLGLGIWRRAAFSIAAAALLAGIAEPSPPESAWPVDPTPARALRTFDSANSKLPQATITELLQDSEGVLWIGTLDGVATFEGREVLPLPRVANAPAFGPVDALARRRRGGVYVGGIRGVHVYDGRRWTLLETRHRPDSMIEDARDVLWMVDDQGGVWRRADTSSQGAWEGVQVSGVEGKPIAVAADAGGVAVAAWGGVWRLEESRWVPVTAPLFRNDPVSSFLVARDGTFWVGTRAGAILFAGRGDAGWTRVANEGWEEGRIRSLAEDSRGRVWAGGNLGRVCFGGKTGAWTNWGPHTGLKRSNLQSLLGDREGTLWFGFVSDGLQQWIGEDWSHKRDWPAPDGSVTRAPVFGITGTREGDLLVAVFSQGLWRYDGRSWRRYGQEDGLDPGVQFALDPEPGVLWVAARYGLYESRRGGRFRRILSLADGLANAVHRAPDGTWYTSTSEAGLFRLVDGTWTAVTEVNQALASRNVRALAWTSSGEMWLGTYRGLAVVSGTQVKAESDSGGGAPESVFAILEVSPGEIWLGGTGGIAVRRGGASRMMTVADGVPGNTVYSLARAPDGSVWAGGSAGVGRYRDGRWSRYDTGSGLLANECNRYGLWTSPDGSVLVGTMASLARFNPVPPLTPPSLKVFWRRVPEAGPDGLIRLASSARRLSLAWSAPWLAPATIEYETRVPGLSPEWSPPTTSNEMTVENLPAGNWEIEVAARFQGASRDLRSQPILARVYVEPFLWERSWVRGLALLLLGAAIVGLVRLRQHRLQEQNRLLAARVDEAVGRLRVMSGLLPICAWCKKIRDDKGYWNQIETFIREHSEADFSHGICPECKANFGASRS